MTTTSKLIDANIKGLFPGMEETGIPIVEPWLERYLLNNRAVLAHKKQAINRQVGFMVDLESPEDLVRAACIGDQVRDAMIIHEVILKSQQVYDLAKGNKDALRRPFGLYPRYSIGPDGRVATVGELSIEEVPRDLRCVVRKENHRVIKAKYTHLELRVLQALSGDRHLGADLASGDPYMAFARRLWGIHNRPISEQEWKTSKAIVRACQLGGGPDEILEQLQCDVGQWLPETARDDAEIYWKNWVYHYPECVTLFEELVQARGDQVVSIFGRTLKGESAPRSHIYSERSTPADRRAIWFPLQATAIDLVKVGLVSLADDYRFEAYGGKFLAVWPHAVALLVPDHRADQAMCDLIVDSLSGSTEEFPLVVKVKSGASLGDLS